MPSRLPSLGLAVPNAGVVQQAVAAVADDPNGCWPPSASGDRPARSERRADALSCGMASSDFSHSQLETCVKPATRLRGVDLPRPECPMIDTNSRLEMDKLKSVSTSVSMGHAGSASKRDQEWHAPACSGCWADASGAQEERSYCCDVPSISQKQKSAPRTEPALFCEARDSKCSAAK
jgi:hypothetical protein